MTMNPTDKQDSAQSDSALERDIESLREDLAANPASEPPELLDQAVLNRARRELDKGGSRRRLRWAGAFATAAVMVLALGIVIRQDPQAPPVPGDENGVILRQESSREAKQESRLEQLEKRAATVADSVEPLQESHMRKATPRAAAGQPAITAPNALEAFAEPADEAMLNETEQHAPSAEVDQDSAVPVKSRQDAALPPVPLASPEDWIEKMQELKKQNRVEELSREVARFRATYPDHPLPIELTNLP